MKQNLLFEFLIRVAVAVILVAVIINVSGCVTEKQRRRICQGCAVTSSVKDSTSVTTKDREVQVTVHDTIEITTPNPCAHLCDSAGNLKKFNQVIPGKKPGTKGRLFTRNDSLLFEAISDSLKAVGHAKDSLIERFREVKQQVPTRCERRHITDWEIFLLFVGKIAIELTVARYILRLLSNYLPWLKDVTRFL